MLPEIHRIAAVVTMRQSFDRIAGDDLAHRRRAIAFDLVVVLPGAGPAGAKNWQKDKQAGFNTDYTEKQIQPQIFTENDICIRPPLGYLLRI